jgi:hypothetical protein
MTLRPFLLAVLALGGLSGRASCLGQDRVSYTPEGAAKPLTIIGQIEDLTGRELVFRPTTGSVQRISADAVEHVETAYEPAHLQGLREFQQGETAAAKVSLRAALDRETRAWVDREILALLVQCEQRNGNLPGALTLFNEIVRQDPATRHWGIAPLVWFPQSVSESLRMEMRNWLQSNDGAERLLAASLLLLDPASGQSAERELNALSRDVNPVLAALSRAQVWRLDLARRQVSDLALASWREQVDRLRKELRSGPQYLLARGYEVRGDLRRSAAEMLWVAYIYPDNEPLAARALEEGAESLQRTGLSAEATVLSQELVLRYPWSSGAQAARSRAVPAP